MKKGNFPGVCAHRLGPISFVPTIEDQNVAFALSCKSFFIVFSPTISFFKYSSSLYAYPNEFSPAHPTAFSFLSTFIIFQHYALYSR